MFIYKITNLKKQTIQNILILIETIINNLKFTILD